ncbi:hypothetical protein GCM10017752_62710 [Streptomyces roseoviridis]
MSRRSPGSVPGGPAHRPGRLARPRTPARPAGPESLAGALAVAVRVPAYRRRATVLVGRLRQEDGVAPVRDALERMERLAAGGPGGG